MGILNVTPDSFSDGGRYLDPAARARTRAADGRGRRRPDRHRRRVDASGRDAGRRGRGDRARRSASSRRWRGEGVAVSVDTRKPAVMRAAIAAGRRDDQRRERADRAGRARGVRRQRRRRLPDAHAGRAGDHAAGARLRATSSRGARFPGWRAPTRCIAAGIARERIVLDPGFGFGKTLAHNLAVAACACRRWLRAGYPVLAGLSRKSSLGQITGRPVRRAPAGEPRRGACRRRARRGDRARARRARDGRCAEGVAAIAVCEPGLSAANPGWRERIGQR